MYHLLITVTDNEMLSITISYFLLSFIALQEVSKIIFRKIRRAYFDCLDLSNVS